MSLDAMNAVWKHSEARGNALLTFLALADNANDDGFAYPSYDHIAAKTRLSKRTVQNQVSELLSTDELSLVSSGTQGRSNVYAVNIAALRSKPPVMGKPAPEQVAESATSGGNPGGKQAATPTVSIPTVREQPVADATGGGDVDGSTLFPVEPSAPSPDTEAHERRVESVWASFVHHFDPKQKDLTPSRRKLIEKALKEVGNNDEGAAYLCQAILGLKVWRKQKPGDETLSAIFATRPNGSALGDQIEFFVKQAESGGTSARPAVPSVLSGTITHRKREVIDMLAFPESPDHRERGQAAVDWLRREAQTEPIIVNGALKGWQAVTA